MKSSSRTRGLRLAAVITVPSAAVVTLGLLAGTGAAQAAAGASRTLAGTRPAWASTATYAGPARAGAKVTTQVYLAGDEAGLAAYAQAVTDTHSADYLHFLTPAQAESRFGARPAAVAAVERWLRGSGLAVRRLNQQEIQATGSIAQAERAYGTQLNEYRTTGGTFRAPATDVRVPASLAGNLLSVGGLSSKPVVMKPTDLAGPLQPGVGSATLPMSTGADGAPFLGPTPCSAYWGQLTDFTDPPIDGAHQPYDTCGYVPDQLRGAYDLSAGENGGGVTVAITDAYASPTMLSDANTYAINHDEQPFAPGQYIQTTDPADWTNESECGGPAGWAPEEGIDVESVHAMAPDARVHYYGANSCYDSDFLATLASIIDTHSADIITNSWGEVISSSTGNEPASTIAVYTELFQQAVAEGIEVSFSAGDCSDENPVTVCGTDDTSTQPQADFPDSDPYVTSVGGTAVEIGRNNTTERVVPWGDDGWLLENGAWESLSALGYLPHGWIYGGGGGTSGPATPDTFPGFTQPWYQKGIVPVSLAETLPTGARSPVPMRTTPDVSMDADPFTGFLVGQTQTLPNGTTGYAESDWGGTSLASPLFAGLVADAEQSGTLPPGFVNPALYQDYASGPGVFRSVITPSAFAAPYTILPAYEGQPPLATELGDDLDLVGTPGYNEAGGVGTPYSVFP